MQSLRYRHIPVQLHNYSFLYNCDTSGDKFDSAQPHYPNLNTPPHIWCGLFIWKLANCVDHQYPFQKIETPTETLWYLWQYLHLKFSYQSPFFWGSKIFLVPLNHPEIPIQLCNLFNCTLKIEKEDYQARPTNYKKNNNHITSADYRVALVEIVFPYLVSIVEWYPVWFSMVS